jgi:hypothetical protein
MELLFGSMPDTARFVVAFLLVLGLIGAGALLWRRFGTGPMSPIGPRGRQQRLAVIDAAFIDVRRRLVLIRRDNTEHLLMIGGPTDIVIEPNIIRTGVREPRPIPVGDTSRQPTSTESPGRTLPPEPTARPLRAIEDLDTAPSEPPRTAREAMADSMWALRPEPASRRTPAAEIRPPEEEIVAPALTPRQPLLGEANYRAPTAPEPRRALPPTLPEPVSQPSDMAESNRMAPPPPRQQQSDENNLAEMAQRLEAALRRPTKPSEPPAPPPAAAARPAPRPEPAAARKAAYLGSVRSPEPVASPPDLKILPGKPKAEPQPPVESLEDEMAKMLGRSPGKS